MRPNWRAPLSSTRSPNAARLRPRRIVIAASAPRWRRKQRLPAPRRAPLRRRTHRPGRRRPRRADGACARAVSHRRRSALRHRHAVAPAAPARAKRRAAAVAPPVVIAPSLDGGYYLVGVRGPMPEIFRAIAWSRSNVLSETVARLRRAGTALRARPGMVRRRSLERRRAARRASRPTARADEEAWRLHERAPARRPQAVRAASSVSRDRESLAAAWTVPRGPLEYQRCARITGENCLVHRRPPSRRRVRSRAGWSTSVWRRASTSWGRYARSIDGATRSRTSLNFSCSSRPAQACSAAWSDA